MVRPFLIGLAGLAFAIAAAARAGTPAARFKPALRLAAVTIHEPSSEPDVAAYWVGPDATWSLPARGRSLLRAPYVADAADFKAAFRLKSRLDVPAEAIPLWPEETVMAKFRALFAPAPHVLVAVDGFEAKLWAWDAAKKETVDKGEIALDVLKPARDSRGEPTARETAALRARFAKALKGVGDRPVVAGITAAPPWAREDGAGHLLLSNLKGFPLATMACAKEGWTRCRLARACFVSMPAALAGHEWSGLAYSPRRGVLLVGDRTAQTIEVFTARECFNVRHAGRIALDPKMKPLRALHVDAADNLWVTTEGSDDYLNASALRFDAKDW